MQWKKISEETPPEGALLVIWIKKERKFYPGYYVKVDKENRTQNEVKCGLIHWRKSNGYSSKISPLDYWLLLPSLIVTETITTAELFTSSSGPIADGGSVWSY